MFVFYFLLSIKGEQCLGYAMDYVIEKLQYLQQHNNSTSGRSRIESFRYLCIKGIFTLLYKYNLEIQALIRFLIEQKYFFSRNSGSVSESMYSLMRCKARRNSTRISSTSNIFTRKDKMLGAMCEALIPYIKAKYYNVGLVLYSVEWIYKVGYLIGRSMYYSPVLHLLQMVIRRVTLADLERGNSTIGNKRALHAPDGNHAIVGASSLYYKIGGIATALLIFAPAWHAEIRQYMRRYRRDWISKQVSGQGIPPPLPPVSGISCRNGICPLCNCTFVNAALSSVSGYVGCYRCFIMYVREHQSCPVTHLPCTEQSIVRIYETSL